MTDQQSPNSITPTFTETSLWRKSRTQTISTRWDVCNKVRDKPVRVALLEFSLWQCTGKVGSDLCRQLSWFLLRTLLQSWH